jgi:hypothetical protein
LYKSALRNFSLITVPLCDFLAKGYWQKIARKMLMKLTPTQRFTWCQFHQHVYAQLICNQIPKAQKDSQVINVSLRFWDLFAQKLLVKR